MKNRENQAKTGVREEDLESLLHQVLREDGKVFPTTEQDIEHLEAEVDQDEVTPIDPARLLARVKGEKEQAGEKVVPLFGDVPKQIQEDMLAMAARNGGQISEDTLLWSLKTHAISFWRYRCLYQVFGLGLKRESLLYGAYSPNDPSSAKRRS